MPIQSAYELLDRSLIYHQGRPVGTAAACDERVVAANYNECFVRDFVPSALVFLMSGRHEIVRNFLETVMQLSGHQQVMKGHKRSMGLMPASFHVVSEGDDEQVDPFLLDPHSSPVEHVVREERVDGLIRRPVPPPRVDFGCARSFRAVSEAQAKRFQAGRPPIPSVRNSSSR